MKITHIQLTDTQNKIFPSLRRLVLLLGPNKYLDVQNVYAYHYKDLGHFNYLAMAFDTIPNSSLSALLTKNPNAKEILQEALQLYLTFQKRGISFDPLIGPLAFDHAPTHTAITKPLDHIHCYRDFFTHEKHVKRGFEKRNEPIPPAWYEFPVYYKGATANFIGANEIIPWPSFTDVLDYELELAVVISRAGKSISEKNAANHIFGFTILNDISARDIQKKEMTVRLGPSKSKDFCSIIGPVIVTPDELPQGIETNFHMQAFINNTLWSDGYSNDAHYSFSEMIAFASLEEWLLPTDLLGSGTVGTGCGLELDKYPKAGDTIELRVEHIGQLINTIGFKN